MCGSPVTDSPAARPQQPFTGWLALTQTALALRGPRRNLGAKGPAVRLRRGSAASAAGTFQWQQQDPGAGPACSVVAHTLSLAFEVALGEAAWQQGTTAGTCAEDCQKPGRRNGCLEICLSSGWRLAGFSPRPLFMAATWPWPHTAFPMCLCP